MKVTVLLPYHAECSATLQKSIVMKVFGGCVPTGECECDNKEETGHNSPTATSASKVQKSIPHSSKQKLKKNIVVVVVVAGVEAPASKAMWSVLEPMFFQSLPPISAMASLFLLENALVMGSIGVLMNDRQEDTAMVHDIFSKSMQVPAGNGEQYGKTRHLLLRIPVTTRYLEKEESQLLNVRKHWLDWSNFGHCHICILLQPYSRIRLEYTFASRLIAWEHQLIRAQSLTGYVSTLGGGFFLCHHFQTAIWLAQQQQRLAVFLNRPDMYLTCWIHQAYSHIYAGYFRSARTILAAVEKAVRSNNKYPTLLAMCKSAKLHCQRMKKASLLSKKSISTTVDDFMRIRVVSDRSRSDDGVRYSLPKFQASF